MSDKIGSLRVDKGIRRIEVNDDGECIEISLNDPTFFERFASFIGWLEKEQKEFMDWNDRFQESCQELTIREDDGEHLNIRALEEYAGKKVELSRNICGRLDILFGENCCRKVFGNIQPDENSIADFIEQITPILQKLADERSQNIQLRYSRSRKGARSGNQGSVKRYGDQQDSGKEECGKHHGDQPDSVKQDNVKQMADGGDGE